MSIIIISGSDDPSFTLKVRRPPPSPSKAPKTSLNKRRRICRLFSTFYVGTRRKSMGPMSLFSLGRTTTTCTVLIIVSNTTTTSNNTPTDTCHPIYNSIVLIHDFVLDCCCCCHRYYHYYYYWQIVSIIYSLQFQVLRVME